METAQYLLNSFPCYYKVRRLDWIFNVEFFVWNFLISFDWKIGGIKGPEVIGGF